MTRCCMRSNTPPTAIELVQHLVDTEQPFSASKDHSEEKEKRHSMGFGGHLRELFAHPKSANLFETYPPLQLHILHNADPSSSQYSHYRRSQCVRRDDTAL
jgi:hypothetical protein